MVLGLIQYVYGRKYLIAMSGPAKPSTAGQPAAVVQEKAFTGQEWGRIVAALVLTLFALIFWAGFEQAGSSLTLFADRATRLVVLGFTYPSSWFQSVEPLFVIIFSPIFAVLWLSLARKRREPSSPAKFTIGLFALSLSFLLMVPAARFFESHHGLRVSPMWLIGLYFLQMVGELCLSPVGLSMVTKLSPPKVVGLMMGFWFFATAMGNYVAGWVAGLVGHRSYSQVFLIAAVIAACVTLILAVMIPIIKRWMAGVN